MKQIFTLLIAISILNNTFGQSQNFNDPSVVTTLQNNCWNIYGIGYNATSPVMEGSGQLYIIPTTSTVNNPSANSNSGQIATPFINFNAGATISFSYRLSSTLGNNATRYITVKLFDGTNYTALSTITVTGGTTSSTIYNPSITVPAGSGVKRLVIEFTGNGDGNTGMYFDMLSIPAPYSYNTSTCAAITTGNSPLPLRLLNFSGNVLESKAQLSWSVAENETGYSFELEKSADGIHFNTDALIFTTLKAGEENYAYKESIEATTFYRLKMINKDNSISYSKVIRLSVNNNTSDNNVKILQNPVGSSLQFSYSVSSNENTTVNIYTSAGTKVFATQLQSQKGNNAYMLNLDSKMNKGFYLLEVINGNERNISKFIKE